MKGYSTGYASSLSTLYLFFLPVPGALFSKQNDRWWKSRLPGETHYQCQLIAGFTVYNQAADWRVRTQVLVAVCFGV